MVTEREKRIITLFSRHGALSKKELAEREGSSWATVVKRVSRLEKAGIVQCVGSDVQPETTGKNPLLYDLADRTPLAIGIDVSYSTTTVILTNLKKEVLSQETCATIHQPTLSQLQEFLISTCLNFAQQHLTEEDSLAGVGIGIPLWLVQGNPTSLPALRKALSAALHTQVRIENNVRSYTIYKKWAGKAFSLDNFILLTIRSGIGTGIFYQGDLIRGAHGMAGELSHLTMTQNGDLCHCGQYGCLETFINQDILYQDYREHILQQDRCPAATVADADIRIGVSELFSLAKHGHARAADILKHRAYYLGVGIAALLKLLDIPHLILAANFGPDGDALIPYITAEVRTHLLPGLDFSIDYYPIETLGFAQGAALFILKEYFTTL